MGALPSRSKGARARGGRTASTTSSSSPASTFPAEERTLHEQESVVDLAGPGAALTPYAAGTNVVLTFGPREDLGNEELEAWARRTTLAVAEELARPTLNAEPAEVERFELGPADESLPAVAALVQLSDLGPLYYQFVYGVPAGSAGLPRIVDPAEILDGAVTCGEYHWAALRNPTIVFQRNALVRALYREHGRRLRFAGVVLMRGYEQTAEDKQRAAAAAAEAADRLGADGAIVTTDAGGNSHTDVMLTVRACEEAGIRTTAIVAEMADPELDELRAHRLGAGGGLDRLDGQCRGARPCVDARARARRRHAARRGPGLRPGADSRQELPRRHQPNRPVRPDGGDMVRAVHYLNQFFAGLGGEEAAGTPPTRLDGPVGPGRGLAAELQEIEIVATLACGDDYFGEHEEEALAALLELLEAERPDLLVAGPAFGSGRYGFACARFSRAASERLGIPALAAMHEENPGVAAADGAVPIAATAVNVAGMREALPRMARLAEALASGRELGPPAEEGYLPRGFRRNEIAEKPGAERAVDLLLAKLAGETRSEVAGGFDRVPPPPAGHGPLARAPRPRHRSGMRSPGQSGQAADDPGAGLAPLRARGRPNARPGPLRVGARRLRRHAGQRGSRTGSSRSTLSAGWSPRAASAGSTTSSTRLRATAPRSPLRLASGARLPPSSPTRGSKPSSSRAPEEPERAAGQCWRRRSSERECRRCSSPRFPRSRRWSARTVSSAARPSPTRSASTKQSAGASSSAPWRCSRPRSSRRPSGRSTPHEPASRLGHPGPPPAASLSPKSAPVCAASCRKRDASCRKERRMTGRAAVRSCSLVLAHAPDLVRHGSKPARELAADADGLLALAHRRASHLRGRARLRAAPGADRQPAPGRALGGRAPLVGAPGRARRDGPYGVIVDQAELYRRLQESDAFGLLNLDGSPAPERRPHHPRGRSCRRLDGGRARPGREPVGLRPPREPRVQDDGRARARAPSPRRPASTPPRSRT